MTVAAKQVYHEALDLSSVDRAELVELLLSSFDFKNRRTIDAAWAKEAEERIDAFDQGKMKARPVSRAFAALERKRSR